MPILLQGQEIKYTIFNGGEVHLNVLERGVFHDQSNILPEQKIVAHLQNSNDVMALLMVVDALRNLDSKVVIKVHIPYLPYARQDRVCNTGEAFSLKVFTQIINSLNLDEVSVCDPHSDVATALLDRVRVIPQHVMVARIPNVDKLDVVVVSPDAGAEKKAFKAMQQIGADGIIYASKVRDTKTGDIVATRVPPWDNMTPNSRLLIVDDICDGGRTFIELAKKLPNNHKYLYVTHGIFSNGLDELAKHYVNIYCPNIIDRSVLEGNEDFLIEL